MTEAVIKIHAPRYIKRDKKQLKEWQSYSFGIMS